MTKPTPSSGYLLCCSPRSGSTLLCDLLTQSRVAGVPESYFRPGSVADYAANWGLTLGTNGWGRSYVKSVHNRGQANTGRFAMRIMWSDMPAFLHRLRELFPSAGSDRERLRAVLGVSHFVHLSRTDKVAQAVSLVIASQTGLWHRNTDGSVRQGAEPSESPQYSRVLIEAEMKVLEDEDREWSKWFAAHSITPLDLTYESLALDPAESTKEVLRFLSSASGEVPIVRTARLATSLNLEWAERFCSQRAQDSI